MEWTEQDEAAWQRLIAPRPMQRSSFDGNLEFSQSMQEDAMLLLLNLPSRCFIRLAPGDAESDRYKIGDFMFKACTDTRLSTIGFRCRKPDCRFRDFTIRSRIPHGTTELTKMKQGHGDFYLYAWTSYASDGLHEWIFVDLHAVRRARLLEQVGAERDNGDGTSFVSLSMEQLRSAEAILAQSWAEQCRMFA